MQVSFVSIYCTCCLTWNCFRYHLSNKYLLGAYMYILASHKGDAIAIAIFVFFGSQGQQLTRLGLLSQIQLATLARVLMKVMWTTGGMF